MAEAIAARFKPGMRLSVLPTQTPSTGQPRRFPFTAFPSSWYSLGREQDFKPGSVQTLQRFGREIVVFRTESGVLSVLDATCPHLGAHLGDGTTRGEELVCPFHGFGFATDGRCSSMPQGYGTKIPPRLAARAWPTRVVNGFLIAYFDAERAAPTWDVPELDLKAWRPILTRSWRVRTHPQETGEGSVDLGHLRTVHRYLAVDTLKPLLTEGPRLRTRYRVTRRAAPGMARKTFDVEFEPQLYGLGYSVVDVSVAELGLEYRIWILATPIDDEYIDYRVALSMKTPERPSALNPALGILPRRVSVPLIEFITFREFIADVELDFPIWEKKAYVHPPALAAGDGPIGLYRRWATQFYGVTGATSASEVTAES